MSEQKSKGKSVKIAVIIVVVSAVLVVLAFVISPMLTAPAGPPPTYHEITIPVGQLTPMPADPYPDLQDHRPVFFMKPGSTAQIYVRYFATWDYPEMVNIASHLSVYNGTTYRPLTNPSLAVSVNPTWLPHKNGENYTVVYTFTAKPEARGIYGMAFFGCYNRGGDLDIAIGRNSSQISPQDIPVSVSGAASCALPGFIENQIIGFVNATVEYKFAIRAR